MQVHAWEGAPSPEVEAPVAANRLYCTELPRHLRTGKTVAEPAAFGEVAVPQSAGGGTHDASRADHRGGRRHRPLVARDLARRLSGVARLRPGAARAGAARGSSA